MDGLTSQNVMPVDGEGLPGKALRKRWCLSFFLKAGRVEMDERWPGSLFQTLEATDENVKHMGFHVHFLFTKIQAFQGTCRGRSRGAANFDLA